MTETGTVAVAMDLLLSLSLDLVLVLILSLPLTLNLPPILPLPQRPTISIPELGSGMLSSVGVTGGSGSVDGITRVGESDHDGSG